MGSSKLYTCSVMVLKLLSTASLQPLLTCSKGWPERCLPASAMWANTESGRLIREGGALHAAAPSVSWCLPCWAVGSIQNLSINLKRRGMICKCFSWIFSK
jgi:hypothetical protein